jgi:hypothetical protein
VKSRIRFIVSMAAVTGFALGQNQTPPPSPPPSPPPQSNQQPAPLFDGQLGTKSSKKDKESSTLGFNGIDPSGKLDQKMLATPATSTSEAKAKKMTDTAPGPGDLDAFIKEGGLNKR